MRDQVIVLRPNGLREEIDLCDIDTRIKPHVGAMRYSDKSKKSFIDTIIVTKKQMFTPEGIEMLKEISAQLDVPEVNHG